MDLLVNLDVDDLEKAVGFYSSVFELKIGRRFGAFGAEMLGSSAPIYFSSNHPGRRLQIQPRSVEITSGGIGRRSILILSSMKSKWRSSERC